ncbi:exosortase-associated EpsI family protein [Haloferula sargassicola]|uniref:Methanolan biosynthesis EpsI domain-containing protein n=1 Tax=Haloferula sargassicola TaxID=490096 RepID=A0ABP9UWG2_9BACT
MKRSLLLLGLLTAGFSMIFFLPDFKEVDSAMSLDLPDYLGQWSMETYPPSEKELKILAKDTRFAKAQCALPRSEEFSYIFGRSPTDYVDLSVVMSGYDLANSIHRPERCMPAQGHHGLQSSRSMLELPNGGAVPVTRILSKQDVAVETPDGRKMITRNCVTYYFFVGHARITESHTERTLIDIKDRVLKGQAQSWAYVSVTMPYTAEAEHQSGAPLLPLEDSDKKIRQLLSKLAVTNIDWSMIGG